MYRYITPGEVTYGFHLSAKWLASNYCLFFSLSYTPEINFLTCHMQFRTPAHWCVSEHHSVRSEPFLFDSTRLWPDEDIQILLLQVRKLFLHHMISLTFVQIYRCSFIISRTRGTSGSLFAPSSYSYPALTTREASWIRYFVCHSALIGIFTFVTFSRCCTCSLSRP